MSIKLTDKNSIKAIIKEMTTEEKALLITGGSTFGTVSMEKYGIPAAVLIDAGVGVSLRQYLCNLLNTGRLPIINCIDGSMGTISQIVYICDHMEEPELLSEEEQQILNHFKEYLHNLVPSGELPSCFPGNSLLASTWNPNVTMACGEQVGKEANAFGIDMLLGTPCINLQRDPRGGRGFEGYSEDPYLITKMAPNYTKGVQKQGVIANVKHFAVNNQETNRQTINSIISERAIREIYLSGFKACVQEGGARSIMTSYNSINGIPAAHHEWLLSDVLRGEWGFDGCVVSDWGGVYDQVEAIKAGNDLCMPGPRSIEPILKAIEDGSLEVEKLNQAVENFLNILVDMPVMKGRMYQEIDSETAKHVAYRAAAEGIVLLRNENHALPLSADSHVAFYGERCDHFIESGLGSGHVHTNKTSSMVKHTAQIVGRENVKINSVDEKTDVVVVTVCVGGQEGSDRDNIELPYEELELFRKAADDAKMIGKKMILILNISGPVELGDILDDSDAILCVYFPGQEGGHAVADILFGKCNPSGKLAQTFPHKLTQCGTYINFPGENNSVYHGEGIFVGYRYFDIHDIEPLYPFGYGLSYTTFEISDLRMEKEFIYEESSRFEVSVNVTNTGDIAGSEVVQLYLRDEISKLPKALRELKGFQKIYLEPGETKTITMYLNKESLSFYDENLGEWVCEPGWFTVYIGNSSRNLPLQARFRAVGVNPYGYSAKTQYTQIVKDPRALKVLLDLIPSDILDEETIKRQTVYIAVPYSIEQAFEDHVRPYMEAEKANNLFYKICNRLKEIDVTDLEMKYQEKEVY